jgi:hypothetical protein
MRDDYESLPKSKARERETSAWQCTLRYGCSMISEEGWIYGICQQVALICQLEVLNSSLKH